MMPEQSAEGGVLPCRYQTPVEDRRLEVNGFRAGVVSLSHA